MIKWVRLDERMIHGQVATKWSRTLGVDRIVVADDTAAASDIMQKSLMMAAPATCKTASVTVDKAVSLCNDPRAAGLKILLIVSTPESRNANTLFVFMFRKSPLTNCLIARGDRALISLADIIPY